MLLSLLLPLPLSSIELAVAGGEPVSRPCIQSHHRHCYSSNFASVLLEFAISAPLKLPLVLFLPVRAIGAAATPFLLSSLLQVEFFLLHTTFVAVAAAESHRNHWNCSCYCHVVGFRLTKWTSLRLRIPIFVASGNRIEGSRFPSVQFSTVDGGLFYLRGKV
ncbi:uncharacterized protein [Arachis hypogaea]|uniref:uncharacterized protein isoform X2 n=1 Tax=Arachis hypogaea TaxID=3818 RepID=UPI0007AEEE4A